MGVSCLDEALPPTMRLPLSGITVLSLEQAIANARLNGVEDFLHHPQLHSRKRIRPVASEAGLQETFLPAVTIPGMEPVMGPIPALGEHTDKILAELGLPLGHSADREAPDS